MLLLPIRKRITQSTLTLWIVVIPIIAAAIETDIFVPSFPAIQAYFSTTPAMVQGILSVNFIGLCISSIFYGPLADAYGRRPVMLTGLGIFALSSIAIVFANSMTTLLALRFLQGIGSSACFVVASAIMYDRYAKEKAAQLMGVYNTVITLTLAFAPILGSFLHVLFGWQANFLFVALLAIAAWFVVACFFDESLAKQSHRPINIKFITRGYISLLTNVRTLACTVIMLSVMSAFMVYVGNLSLIFIDYLHIDEKVYGIYQAIVILAFALMSVLSGTLICRYGMDTIQTQGKFWSFSGACLLLVTAIVRPENPALITASMAIFSAGFALVFNIVYANYMSEFPDIKGIASAWFTALRLLFSALAIGASSLVFNGSIVPIALFVFVLSLIATLAFLALMRYDAKQLPDKGSVTTETVN